MIRKSAAVAALLLWSAGVQAAEGDTADSSLKANLKRVAVEISSTDVSNAKEYQNSPVSALNSDSQTVYKGVLDFILEYNNPTSQWNNRLFMNYGKTTLKPAEGRKTSSENNDEILFTSDYSRKVWRYADADVGPFASLGYQTEFTANDDAPKTQIVRLKSGIKLFNGTYIKDLYAAAVVEEDFTYSPDNTKTAFEVGIRAEYPLREGVTFETEGYYRDYLTYSRYQGTDFRYDLNVNARMKVQLFDKLSFGPVVAYRRAQSREADVAGSNLMIGVSLEYSDLYSIF